jgi:DNA topoisomerase-2
MWVLDGSAMVYRTITFVPGLYKIFDEILVNGTRNVGDEPFETPLPISKPLYL